ncbi:MAG: exported protein of unknown function [candidate division NC10 bacterium]|nr:exported protein of unknown function [candidate division NC10 bacterium]
MSTGGKAAAGVSAVALGLAICMGQGCTPSKLAPEELVKAQQQPHIHAVHYPPRLEYAVITKAGGKGEAIGKYFGVVGLVAGGMSDLETAQRIGVALKRDYGIEDPVVRVKTKLAEILALQARLSNIRPVTATMQNDDPSELKRLLGSGLVLDFKTVTWMTHYTAADASRYVSFYRARSRLMNLSDGTVLWEGECKAQAQDPKKPLTFDELTANQGAALKAHLQDVADWCASDLSTQLMGKDAAP